MQPAILSALPIILPKMPVKKTLFLLLSSQAAESTFPFHRMDLTGIFPERHRRPAPSFCRMEKTPYNFLFLHLSSFLHRKRSAQTPLHFVWYTCCSHHFRAAAISVLPGMPSLRKLHNYPFQSRAGSYNSPPEAASRKRK